MFLGTLQVKRPVQRKRNESIAAAAGIGAGLMLVFLLVLQSLTGSGLFTTRTVTVTTVTTSDPYEQVSEAYANHISQFNAAYRPCEPCGGDASKNTVSEITSGYESNATVQWVGRESPGGVNGSSPFSGSDISIQFVSFLSTFNRNFSLSIEFQSLPETKGSDMWMINSTLNFQGYNAIEGNEKGTIVAEDVYQQGGGSSWLISTENWNFTQWSVQDYVNFGY